MKNLTKTICVITILLVIACKKEETPVPIGNNGLNGTNGTTTVVNTTTGTAGEIVKIDTIKKTDSMKVYYSDWFTPGTWSSSTTTTGNGTTSGNGSGTTTIPSTSLNQSNSFNKSAPAITNEILDKGVVLAYCRLTSDGSNTRPLPANTTISGVLNLWNYILSLGNIQFTQYSMSPIALYGIDNSNKFRYVVIPSNTHLRLKKPLNEMSYDEVCEMYNIPK